MARPGISEKNAEKIPPPTEILEPQENTPKIPIKYPKWAFLVFWGRFFSVFSGYFWGKFWESRISGLGVFFGYFSWKFRVRPSSGLCGRLGRSHVNLFVWRIFGMQMSQKFREGVGRQRGLARGNPSYATSSPCVLCPLRRRGTHFWRTFWALFGFVCRQPPPANPFSKPLNVLTSQ